MDYPKFDVSNQKEESISMQRVEGVQLFSKFQPLKIVLEKNAL